MARLAERPVEEAIVDPDAVERRLAAVLSADVAGYGRLMAADEVATLRLLTAYREQVAVLVRQHRGRLVDSPGDNLLAEFPSALAATRCAIEVQRVVAARNAGLPADRQMSFRIGVHLGDVMVEGERIYGDGVNIAARLEALAEPGGVAVSGAVHAEVRGKVPVEMEDLGATPLKNVPHPVQVFRMRVAASAAAAETPPDLPGLAGRRDVAFLVLPAVWVSALAIVAEILFMLSPLALYYYSAYGPSLNRLHRSPWTAWLTGFFLPHFSETGHPVLDRLHESAALLMLAGATIFGAAFVQVYRAKLAGGRAVTGGLYAAVRHPQYLGLAVLGLGTLLLWPRFLVLVGYVTMLFLYAALARWEEARCEARFGAPYREYRERTARRLPGRLVRALPRILPAAGRARLVAGLALYGMAVAGSVGLGVRLRDASLARVTARYTERMAVISPARLREPELDGVLRLAADDAAVRERLAGLDPAARLLVYVVPEAWALPDLPIEAAAAGHGRHGRPADFDRRHFKVLLTTARLHDRAASGPDIVRKAYGGDPVLLVRVDIETARVTGIETPPPHVRWGDIPTPLF